MTQFAYPGIARGSFGGDVAVEDWDDLFRAVTGRLVRLVRSAQFSTPANRAEDSAVSGISVLECVEALEQCNSPTTTVLDSQYSDGLSRRLTSSTSKVAGSNAPPIHSLR